MARVTRLFRYPKGAFAGPLHPRGNSLCRSSLLYAYYRCSYARGKCDLPYIREVRLSDQMGSILKDIYVPEHVVTAIVDSMTADQSRAEAQRTAQITTARQRLTALRTRMDQAYEDKLDGKLDEAMWTRKMQDWREQEIELEGHAAAA